MSLDHARAVCLRMRESDRRVISTMRFQFNEWDFALDRFETDGLKVAALAGDGQPVAIGGLTLTSPGVWTAWLVGTARWREVTLEAVKFARATLARLLEFDAHRIQAHIAAEDAGARKYAEYFGFKYEGTLEQHRADRGDLAVYAIVRQRS
jgi:RimJ/RimL family protein N-acetyltransferase